MASSSSSSPGLDAGTDPVEGTPPEPFRLNVFQTLDTSQTSNGITHQDYAGYHRYCTARLARLRHLQAVRSTLVHNHKYVEGVSGRRHAYCSREIPETIENENILWNLFYQAERAWAQACALQKPTNSKKSSHSYILRRLKKAAKWACLLEKKAKSCCVEETVSECQSYAAWMTANAALEQKNYLLAFQSYKQSMTLLLQLAENMTSSSSSPDALALGDMWSTRAETVLRPLVRYCAYEARDQINPADLKETAAQATGQKLSAGDSILLSFRGKQIALDSYKQLAVLYLKMENLLAQDLDENQFLKLLTDLDDALRIVQAESSHYDSLPAGPAVTAKREELQALSGFFQYQKLSVWRHQQEGRIQELTEDAEILHVYDTLRQNAEAMADLPGSLGNDEHLEEDPFWLEAQAHVIRIRAFRCYYLARLYESTLNGTPSQVLALLRQSLKLTKRAQEEISACDDIKEADAYLVALDVLASNIEAMTCRVEAARFLMSSDGGGGGNLKTNRPLWMRLDDLDAGTVLADNPPLPIPVPCKPSFFDLAWQHVDTDMPLDEIQEYIKAREPKKGFLASWFGSS